MTQYFTCFSLLLRLLQATAISQIRRPASFIMRPVYDRSADPFIATTIIERVGGGVWKRRVVRDGSPTEQSNAADKSIILTWPRTRRATYLSFEVASTFYFCFYSVFAYLVLFFVYVSVFASVQKFPPSAGWKWTRSKAITSTQLPKAVNVKHSGFKTIAQGVGTSYGNIKARNLLKYFKQNLSCF